MRDKNDWRKEFIDRLLRLADPVDPDRATLAELRRSLGRDRRRALYRAGRLFNRISSFALDDALLVAALFASHAGSNKAGSSVGTALGELRDRPGGASIEKRFVALLDSEREDLDEKLRQVVSLLKSKVIGLDWEQLLTDLRQWTNESRWVQRRWARDFWAEVSAEPVSAGAEATPDASAT